MTPAGPVAIRRRWIAALIASTSWLAPAAAQTDASRVSAPGGQIDTTPAALDTSMAQIARRTDAPAAPSLPTASADEAPALPTATATLGPLTQIDASTQADPAMAQVSHRDRSTQTGQRAATPGERRNVQTAPVAGADRCDPQARDAATPFCRRVIETRADSFATERPDLSPEQRLLAERRPGDEARGLLAEVRRVGRNDVDPNSTDAQTLAAILQAQQNNEQAAAAAAAAAEEQNGIPATIPAEVIEAFRPMGQ